MESVPIEELENDQSRGMMSTEALLNATPSTEKMEKDDGDRRWHKRKHS